MDELNYQKYQEAIEERDAALRDRADLRRRVENAESEQRTAIERYRELSAETGVLRVFKNEHEECDRRKKLMEREVENLEQRVTEARMQRDQAMRVSEERSLELGKLQTNHRLLATDYDAQRAQIQRLAGNATEQPSVTPVPVPLLLWCPSCGERHVDRGELETKVHHTHACQACGMTWRPALVATVGVQYLPGFKDVP